VQAEQTSGDDEPLHLARALADGAELRVAQEAFDGEVFGVAVATVDLDGVERDFDGGFARARVYPTNARPVCLACGRHESRASRLGSPSVVLSSPIWRIKDTDQARLMTPIAIHGAPCRAGTRTGVGPPFGSWGAGHCRPGLCSFNSSAYTCAMAQPSPVPPPGFDTLSVDEQIDYVHALWARIVDGGRPVPVPDWHRKEIEERRARPSQPGRSWEEVRAELVIKHGLNE